MHFSFVDMTSHEVSNDEPVLLLTPTDIFADQEPSIVRGCLTDREINANDPPEL